MSAKRTRKKKDKQPSQLVCQECGLVVLEEEAHIGRFSLQKMLCARCVVHELQDKGEIDPPSCFGNSYDAGNFLCTDRCNLNQACLLQFTDAKMIRWAWEESSRGPTRPNDYMYICSRILRLAGRIMHVYDLGPILECMTGGNYTVNKDPEYILLKRKMRKREDIEYLGDGFYVWFGYLKTDSEGE